MCAACEVLTCVVSLVCAHTQTRLHVKIYDPNNERWEVPRVALTGLPAKKAATTEYRFSYTTKPFGFAVSRRATGEVLFNTTTTGTSPPHTRHTHSPHT
jgi:hypothetical protein